MWDACPPISCRWDGPRECYRIAIFYLGATGLTAVNDNALITYLATLVPNLGADLKLAVVQ